MTTCEINFRYMVSSLTTPLLSRAKWEHKFRENFYINSNKKTSLTIVVWCQKITLWWNCG